VVADTSHQLRNPLAALRLRADTLDGQVADAARSTYSSMLTEVERLEGLLDDLLTLAAADSAVADRAAGDRITAAVGRCEAAPVVAERVAAWTPAAAAAGLRLTVDGGPATAVAAPAGVVAQVIDVLLDNAVKYAGAGATVALSWTVPAPQDDGGVRLAVRDDGPGLPPGTHALATERFWRSEASRDRRSRRPGSGPGSGAARCATRWPRWSPGRSTPCCGPAAWRTCSSRPRRCPTRPRRGWRARSSSTRRRWCRPPRSAPRTSTRGR
jgi:signal transduction histidine kinase